MTDRNRSRVLSTRGVRGVMPRSQRAIPRKRGDEKMGKKNEMQNSASRCSRDKDGTGWVASRDQAGFERSKLVQGDVFLETVGQPAMEHGRRGDDDVRPVAAPQWSIIRLVSAGRLGRRPPNTKESPGRDLFVPTSPPPPLYSTHRSPSFDTLSRRPSSVLHSIAHHRITPFSIPQNLSTSWPTLSSSSRPLAL